MIIRNSIIEQTEKNSYDSQKLNSSPLQYNYLKRMDFKKPISLFLFAQKLELLKQTLNPTQAFNAYLSLSRQILYFLRISSSPKFETRDIYPFLLQWVRNFAQIYQKSQCKTFDQPFSKFLFTLKRFISYSKIYDCKEINGELLRLGAELSIYRSQQESVLQINIGSQEIDNCFISLMENKFFLPNNSCVSCAQMFVERQKVFTSTLSQKNFICVEEAQIEDQEMLKKSFCSILNSGGGVIMIGAKKVVDGYCIKGVNLKNQDILSQKITFYYQISRTLRPLDFHIDVDWVVVHSIIPSEVRKDIKVCFRIKINPLQKSRMFYIQTKKCSTVYEAYGFDSSLKIIKYNIKQFEGNLSNNFYSASHYRYYLNELKQKTHQGTECYKACKGMSCQFPKYYTSFIKIEGPEGKKEEKLLDNISKPKYQHISLLIPGKKKGGRKMIREILSCLQNRKIAFQMQEPFRKSFTQQTMPRLVYMISHEIHFIELKKLLKQLAIADVFKWENLVFMPVYNNLQIGVNKVKEIGENILKDKLALMQKLFHRNFISFFYDFCEENQTKTMLQYQFNSINQSIYAYLIFESLQLRPYFKKISGPKSCQI